MPTQRLCLPPYLDMFSQHFRNDAYDAFTTVNGAIGNGITGWITLTNQAFLRSTPEGAVLSTVMKVAAARDAEGAIISGGLNNPSLPTEAGAAAGLIVGTVVTDAVIAGLGTLALPWVIGATVAVGIAALATIEAQALVETIQDASAGDNQSVWQVYNPDTGDWDNEPNFDAPLNSPSPVGGAPGCTGLPHDQRKLPPGLPGQAPTFSDPLILDLAGSGLNLTGLASSSAYFDYSDSGIREHTGWLGTGMGMLVTAPQDGATVSAANVLGCSSGNGFGDLAALDANADGVIDAADPGFANLRVWVDTDGDGVSKSGELYALADLGVVSINLDYQRATTTLNGNAVTATATFTKTDGTTHSIAEVNFANNRQDTIVTAAENIPYTLEALRLPDLDGYGSMPDLRLAMSQSADLTNAVLQLVENAGSMSGDEFDAAFTKMLKMWAGIPDTPPPPIYSSSGGDTGGPGTVYVDPSHVAFIYAFYGIDPTTDPYYQQSPNWHNGPTVWEPRFQNIVAELKTRFVSQIAAALANHGAGPGYLLGNVYTSFAGLGWDQATDSFVGNFQTVFDTVASQGLLATDATKYWGQVLPILEGLKVELDPSKGETVATLASEATLAGIPTDVLTQFVNALGLVVDDEGAMTGAITEEGDKFVLVGSGDKTISVSGTVGHSLFVYDGASGGNVSLTGIVGDTVLLRDLTRDDISVGIDDGTVVITVKSTGHQLRLSHFLNYQPEGVIELADRTRILSGNVLDFIATEVAQALGPNSQDDSLADTAIAALGLTVVRSVSASTMTGTGDYNVFEPPLDQSGVTIECNGAGLGSILRLGSGVDPSDIAVRQANDGHDLIITVTSTGEQITLQGQGDLAPSHIAYVSFADGTLWSAGDLWAASNTQATSDGASVIHGLYGADQLVAGAGSVTLVAQDPGATLTTGAGADKLETVGKGNTLILHSDTTSVEISSNGADFTDTGLNVLKLAAGLTAADIVVTQSSNHQDLILTLSTGQVITLDHALSGSFGGDGSALASYLPVDQIAFSDGTSLSWQDLIDRSIATMEALGNDTVFDGDAYGASTLHAGVGTVTLDASQRTSIDPLTLIAGTGHDTLIGGIADTTYVVGADATNVTIEKLVGAQRRVATAGNNNVLSFGEGVDEGDISVAADSSGRNLILTNASTGATVTLINQISGQPFETIETVTFADGVTWSALDLINKANATTPGGTIFGTSGNDTLTAPNVAATLSGKGGDDTLISGPANTLMAGGTGSDHYVVNAGDGPVTIDDAHDQTGSSNDRNTLEFGEGILPSDIVVTQSANGQNVIITDTATGQTVTLHNQLTTGGKFDQIDSVHFFDGTVWSQEDLLEKSIAAMASNGATVLYGDDFDNTIVAGDGDKTIYSGQGADTIVTGAGNQVINQESGNGTVEIGAGSYEYVISGSQQATVRLHGIDPDSLIVSQANDGGDLVLRSPLSGETITLAAQFEDRFQIVSQVVFDDGTIWTSADLAARSIANAEAEQAPIVYGDQNANVLTGGATDQTLIGRGGNDTLIAGTGNDTLIGANSLSGNEQDTYVVNATAGNTVIVEQASVGFSGGFEDTLQFGPGIDPADVAVTQSADGQAIILTMASTGKTVTIDDVMAHPRLQVTFDDGTIWSPADLWSKSAAGAAAAHAAVIYGDSADNLLVAGDYDVTLVGGGGGNDTFVSGTADATFVGSIGDSLYEVSAGAGTITVENGPEGTTSTLAYQTGIDPADIEVRQDANGHDLLLVDTQSGQTVVLRDQIATGDTGSGGGGPLGLMALDDTGALLAQTTQVTFADGTTWTVADLLAKSVQQANADGAATIYGDRNANTLTAGSGDVTLVGQGGNDTFVNGSGNDVFVGSRGFEQYEINAKSNTDTIVNATGQGSHNVVAFGSGIAAADIAVAQSADGQDLILTDSVTGQTLVLEGQIAAPGDDTPAQTDEIDFADGTSWSVSDLLDKSVQAALDAGNSTIYGDRNDNLLTAGDADVTLVGQGGDDTLVAGIGNDVLIGGGGYTTYRIGSSSSSYVVEAQEIDAGPPGGGGGGPVGIMMAVQGEPGTFSVNEAGGFGELDLSGIDPTTLRVSESADGNDAILTDPSTGQVITIRGQFNDEVVQQVNFDDGTSWSSFDLYDKASASDDGNYEGTPGDDSFDLTTGFTVHGGLGDDHYSVSGDGSGTFYFAKGDGHDLLDQSDGGSRSDTLILTDIDPDDVSVVRVGDAVTLTVISTGDSFEAASQFHGDAPGNAPQGLEQVQFADGTIWNRDDIAAAAATIRGTSGNDNLSGTSGADILVGGTGNDVLTGGDGGDVYRFAPGDGQDVITDYTLGSYSAGVDTIALGAGILPADVSVSQASNGNDLVLNFAGSSDQITISNAISASQFRIEQVTFADGTTWSYADLMAKSTTPTSGNDVFHGDESNQSLSGGAGDDTLYGMIGDDILTGGTGNDVLKGGPGSDTYVFAPGDGNDRIDDAQQLNMTNTIQLGAGITPQDTYVTAAANGLDLVVGFAGSSDTITINFMNLSGVSNGVDQMQFADGTIWSRADMLARRSTVTSGSGSGTVTGTADIDTLVGSSGTDTLKGLAGNDLLVGGAGNDTLSGGAGDDVYHYGLGDGADVINDVGDGSGGSGGNDVLQFGIGIAPGDVTVSEGAAGNDFVLSVAGGGSVTLQGTIIDVDNSKRIEQVRFADGTMWSNTDLMAKATVATSGNDTFYGDLNAQTLQGGAGNDVLVGRSGDDILIGGTGNDTLNGGNGSDTYVFNPGDGQDFITNEIRKAGVTNVLQLGAGLAPGDVVVSTADGGNDIVIGFANSTDQITIDQMNVSTTAGIDEIHFNDGTVWTHDDILAALPGSPAPLMMMAPSFQEMTSGPSSDGERNGQSIQPMADSRIAGIFAAADKLSEFAAGFGMAGRIHSFDGHSVDPQLWGGADRLVAPTIPLDSNRSPI